MRTEQTIETLKKLPNGWHGMTSKKPSARAVKKIKSILSSLEIGHMPWPEISPVPNGGLVLTWISLTRDIIMTIDPEGDAAYATSLKIIADGNEIVDRLDSEGHVSDIKTVDHMMAWYMMDQAAKC